MTLDIEADPEVIEAYKSGDIERIVREVSRWAAEKALMNFGRALLRHADSLPPYSIEKLAVLDAIAAASLDMTVTDVAVYLVTFRELPRHQWLCEDHALMREADSTQRVEKTLTPLPTEFGCDDCQNEKEATHGEPEA